MCVWKVYSAQRLIEKYIRLSGNQEYSDLDENILSSNQFQVYSDGQAIENGQLINSRRQQVIGPSRLVELEGAIEKCHRSWAVRVDLLKGALIISQIMRQSSLKDSRGRLKIYLQYGQL